MAGSEPDEGLDPAEVVPTDNSTGAPVELPVERVDEIEVGEPEAG
jgi:hypothetical protein